MKRIGDWLDRTISLLIQGMYDGWDAIFGSFPSKRRSR